MNEEAQRTDRHDPYAAFRVRDYRRYLVGWVAGMVGTQIQGVAIGWEMYQRTGEALALGFVGLAQAAPTIILALPAGYLADRFSRRRVLMLSLAGMTLTSIGLGLLSYLQGPVYAMYALLVLDASFVTMARPSRTAMAPQLVPRDVFPNAVAWNTSMMQVSWVVGPAFGGLVINYTIPGAYGIAALGSVLYILLLSRIEIPGSSGRMTDPPLQVLLGGLTFVRHHKLILTLMALDMFAVLLGGAVYLLPIFAEDILDVGPQGFGWLRSAPAAGALCMALLIAHLPPMKRAGRNLLFAIGGFGLATIVFGLSQSFWLSWAMLFLTGLFDNVSMVIRHTLVQLRTPDAMRGRVSAVNYVFVGASNELGGMESGLVAHWFGPIFSVVSGGIGTIAVVLVAAVSSGELRKTRRLSDEA